MNLIFKIVNYFPETEQIEVKYCRQNSPKSINEYPSGIIDCKNIDFTNYDTLVQSIMNYGTKIIDEQEKEEGTLADNIESEVNLTTLIEDKIGKVISMDSNNLNKQVSYRMKKINL